jgi:hypothetical protein
MQPSVVALIAWRYIFIVQHERRSCQTPYEPQ